MILKCRPALACLTLALIHSYGANATPFYRETFPLCSSLETSSKSALDIAGWKALQGDSPFGKGGYLKINIPGSPDHLAAFSSFPAGSAPGAAFWTRNAKELTIFTQEFSFDIANLALVEYQQRLSGLDSTLKHHDGTQLAFLIRNTWYISDQPVKQLDRGVWESVSLVPSELTYGTVSGRNGRGPTKPENANITLPSSGPVTAFGVFLSDVHGRVRIDNFTLSDLSLQPLVPSDSGADDRCVVSDPGPDNAVPGLGGSNESQPPPARFCRRPKTRTFGKVNTSQSIKRSLLLSVTGESLEAKRNRAILGLLLSNNLRIEELVNLRIGDYFSARSSQFLRVAGKASRVVSIRASVKRLLDDYLAASGYSRFSKLPLLQFIGRKSGKPTGEALCAANIVSIVKNQAHTIKVLARLRFAA